MANRLWTPICLAAALQSAPDTTSAVPRGPEIDAALPDTALYVSLAAPGFVETPALAAEIARRTGKSPLICGRIDGADLVVTFEPDEPHRTSAQWRERAEGGERFEVDGVACREIVHSSGESNGTVRFDAYVVAGGSWFDVQASSARSSERGGPPLEREGFEDLVRSLRVQYVRRGRPADLPRQVRDTMDRALRAWPRWRDALQEEQRRQAAAGERGAEPDPRTKFALLFASGQLARYDDAPSAELVASHEAVVAAFDALKEPDRAERFAGALALETLGLSRALLGNVPESVAPLERALAIGSELEHPARAGIAYNLACSHARLGAVEPAVRTLKVAISLDERYRALAADDRDFSTIRDDERFQALLETD